MHTPARIGMIGCGNISSQYFEVAHELPEIEIVACGDAMRAAAEAQAEKYGLERVLEPDEILAAPDIDIVLNLTPPGAHYAVAKAALEAGKATYSEKPFALRYAEGAELTYLHGVAVSGAMDVPGDLDVIEVPAVTWVVFRVAGEYPAALQATWAATATDWFPSNPWRLRPGPSIVTVLERSDDFSTATCELWLPVERA